MERPISILCLEDSPLDLELSTALLKRAGIAHQVTQVETEEGFTSALRECRYDLILADYVLPSFDGLTALSIARQHCPETPFVFVSGAIGEEVAIDSLHRGATDYVLKHRLERLAPAVKRAMAEAAERRARRAAERAQADLLQRETLARAEAESHAQELAQANAELEQFASAASHDLQEPLRIVKSYAQLLSRRYRSQLDGSGLEFIGYIEQGVTRMEHLIRDLLSYTRVTHEKTRELEPIDLEQIVQRMIDELQPLLKENGATVSVGKLPRIKGDGGRISYVFQNLLSNSIKYRNHRTPEICISAEKVNNEWMISVKDNGIGFEPRYAEYIFGMFKRLHGGDYPGTGVGLAIARRIVEQHGGRIWAESTPGVGTTFYFTLQAAQN